jgi:hypothetical protein
MGKVRGALARHAEDTYEHLPSDAHRELARALFLRLIEPGATEQDTTRRRATSNELKLPDAEQTQLLRETADIFVSARLLITAQAIRSTDTLTEEKQPSTQQHTSGSTIEVSHEALIREWDRLGGWLRDARDDISLQMGVANEASEWLRRDRPDDMLYRGTVLEGAEAWMERSTASVDEVLFITESRRAEEDRIAERRATRRRMRLLAQAAIILLVITVISLSVTVFAVSQQATEAQQQQLTLEVQATTALGAQSQAEEAQAGAEAAQQTLEVAQATAVEQAALSGTQVSHANATLTLIPATLDAAEAEVAAAESARAAAQNDGSRGRNRD